MLVKEMQQLLAEAKETAAKVNNWLTVEQREGWKIFTGNSGDWNFVVGVSDDGSHADGAGTKITTVLRLTPELALEVGRMAAKHIEENKA